MCRGVETYDVDFLNRIVLTLQVDVSFDSFDPLSEKRSKAKVVVVVVLVAVEDV